MGTPENPDFDYIVIGSGAGGGPVAARLAEAGYVVGLIEAGKEPEQLWCDVPVFHAFASEHPDISWQFFVKHFEDETRSKQDTKYRSEEGGIFYPRAGALGGCTQHHAMITVYPHNSDWQYIADLTGDSSWAPDKMRAYFEKLERCTYSKDPAARHGTNGWLTTSPLDLTLGLGDPAVVQTVLKAIKTAWLEGFSGVLPDLPQDPNDWRTPQFEGIAFAPLSTLEGRRAGTRELIIRTRAKLPQKLIIKQSTLAAKILFDANKRAIGVECWEGQHLYRADPNASNDNDYEVKKYYCAREVILAGGAFNSPQLLMLSGIGPKAHLQQFNIPVVADRAGVGTNLQDRYEISVVSEMKNDWKILANATFEPPPTTNETGDPCYVEWQGGKGVYTTNGALLVAIKKSSPDRPDPDLFMFAIAGKFSGYYPDYSKDVERTRNFLTWLVLKAHTENHAGYVRLKSSDPRERPEINFKYFDDPAGAKRDTDAVLEGVKFVRKVSKHNTAIKSEVSPGAAISTDDQVRQYIQDNAWGHHASCSNPMGKPSDPNAVVDSNFRVIGVGNLRIVDASVFPKIPGFFIVTPIYMIAEKAADVIVAHAKNTPAAAAVAASQS
ncbi:MAG TPA: GMC family oxidoreductase [Thermoanaerobaculia bacterium]|nr:GMC family oxidoreductase [Thermoanaerobaculia bacterium]